MIPLQGMQQVLESEEGDGEAVLHGLFAERHGQARLLDSAWPLEQVTLPLADPGTGRQRLYPALLDARLEAELEVAQRLTGSPTGRSEVQTRSSSRC